MTPEIGLTFALLLGAAILFASERVRPDLVAMASLAILLLTRQITTDEAFGVFSNSAVVVLGSVFIIGAGLAQTGFGETVGRRIMALTSNERSLTFLVMLVGSSLSAFMHNTGTAAILMPAVMGVAKQAGISPSRLLFPLSIGILAGGSLTLIGTAPNVLVSEILRERGMTSFGFFTFTPIVAPIVVALIAFVMLFGDRLLPERRASGNLLDAFHLREYLSELRVTSASSLVGKPISTLYEETNGSIRLIGLVRQGQRFFAPPPSFHLRADDVLLVRSRLPDIQALQDSMTLVHDPEVRLTEGSLSNTETILAEVTLAPRSDLVGCTLSQVRFQQRYSLVVLAIWRHGTTVATRLADTALRYGDALLVQGTRDQFQQLQESDDFLILQEIKGSSIRRRKAPLAIGILMGVVVATVTQVLPVPVALFLGAGAMVVTGVLSMDQAYEAVDWQTIFIVAGMLPFGIVMERTGAAALIASTMIGWLGEASPVWLLAGTFIVTMLLSEVVSNDVSTLLVAPLAFSVAEAGNLNPLPLLMSVALGAGIPFITPFSHGPNLLIYGPGNFRFRDYFTVGLPVSIITLVISLIMIPIFLPF